MKRALLLLAVVAIVFATPTLPQSDSVALSVVGRMVSAHGGIEKWSKAPSVYFEDDFIVAVNPQPFRAQVTVEQGQRRAYVDYPDMNASICWDGEQAWSVNWKVPTPPRFLYGLNYYFLNLPWLTNDPGVIVGNVDKGTLFDDPTEYVTVLMSFEAGTGDTPDDYYALYIDPKTLLLKGCRYVVTYTSLLDEGKSSTEEHILIFDAYETVDGLVVPTHYTIYDTNHGEYASCTITNWSFSKEFDEARMTMPDSAVVDTSKP